MAKITVVGQAFVVTSNLKFEDILMLKKYRPASLTLFEGEGNEKEPVFAVGTTLSGGGSIGKYGAEFSGGANGEGYAQITQMIPDWAEDPKEYVAEAVGVAILHLNKLEATLPAVLEEIKREKEQIAETIRVIQ